MASARELLEQADRLMRRNRGSAGDIPVLTEVVVDAPRSAEPAEDVPLLTDVVEAADESAVVPEAAPDAPRSEAEPVPMAAAAADQAALTRSAEAIPVGLPLEGEPSDWLVMDTIDPATHSITGVAPDTLAAVPPVTLKADAPELGQPPQARQIEAPDETLPAAAPGEEPAARGEGRAADAEIEAARRARAEDERWRALADQISMQVLQRVDLFTDSGLKTQLAEHLRPVVERAGAELVNAITEHVGALLRSYVAEAIEREIAQWRREH